ncbi:hypothetical protein PsorP6_002669 [Peronosclerospora sorghi]|uniref:Uncharacterized protein n=1 Tax=Peronosclerospora sorghi TaxID=230839 RepID=A0ACC0WUL9_9STRA|nr:hypothetical protein PsorP6_002669 [Peronosclerospora sorghi]
MSDEECVTLLRGKNEGQDDVVPLPISLKTVFMKLFVNFYDLTSRAILVLGKVSVSSNVVTGAVMQGYKVLISDLEIFLKHARTEYDEVNAGVLGNELFLCDTSKKRKKHALQFGNLDGKYPSLLTFFETLDSCNW